MYIIKPVSGVEEDTNQKQEHGDLIIILKNRVHKSYKTPYLVSCKGLD